MYIVGTAWCGGVRSTSNTYGYAYEYTHKCNTALTYPQVLLADLTPTQLAIPTIYIITYARLLLYIVMVFEISSSNHTATFHIV